jgi:Tol biopolymer transport system component/tRNA A-37 threonylcarbamoyl transferase component Bud32
LVRIFATLSSRVMKLAAGTRLGPYELVSLLGAGGMGEVYRATDTRIDRTVAIKVLRRDLSDNPELKQRFEREAKAVSSLQHPYICTLHDIGQQDGIDYLVMEFLEGQTLADRLAKGPLPTDQVLRYAIQIADALDKAHRTGITHRDLKPGNIMLTKSGAKLLDFGLAKFHGKTSGPLSDLTSVPTERQSITAEGTIIGSFQYMAPEQLEGGVVDPRTDIFAFGAVVYEMATGKRAFTGKSQASLITAIMSSDPPPISAMQPMIPLTLDRLVKTCLAKDAGERWQSAHDLMLELKWIAEVGSSAGAAAPADGRGKIRERVALIAACVGLLGLLAALPFAVAYLRRAPVDERVLKVSVLLPEKAIMSGGVSAMALSPDGRRLAFVASFEGRDLLWVRSLDSHSAQALPGSDGALNQSPPFWSPDSRFIGFFAGGKLKKIDASGGPPQTLCDIGGPRGGTWNREGVIVFAPVPFGPLYQVSAAGGEPTPVTALHQSDFETAHRWPYFLPDGRHFLYFARSSQAESEGIYVGSLDAKETKRLLPTSLNAAYAPPGFLLFLRNETLMAQRFDADKLELTGEPLSVVERVAYNPGLGRGAFSVSENGVLAFRSGGGQINQPLWFDRQGKQIGSLGAAGLYLTLWLSPDERRAAVDRSDPQTGTNDIWLFDLSRGIPSRFTTDPAGDTNPLWSPDGSRIVFASTREGVRNLYQKIAGGGGNEEVLLKSSEDKVPDDWSLDGQFIVYQTSNPKTKWDLWVLPMSGYRQSLPFLQTEFNEGQAQFSPDGKWIAYTSDESGAPEVYVQTFPASEGKWRVSSGSGSQPKWRRDSRELFYIAADRKLMAVDVKLGATFDAGVPKALFDTRVLGLTEFRNHYAPTSDGQRFLINSTLEETSTTPISVVVNWTADLKR